MNLSPISRLFGRPNGSSLFFAAVFLVIIFCLLDLPTTCFAVESSPRTRMSQLSYLKLLKTKHAEQLKAAKSIVRVGDYAKQYKMLTMIYQKMFEIVADAKLVIESSGYVHGEDFPVNGTVREALSTTVENSLFFGNILLRLPDITHSILAKNKEWRLTLQWSWQLCSELRFLDSQMRSVLDLAGQELGFVDKDPDYENPFKLENQKDTTATLISDKQTQPTAKSKKKKPSKSRGPKLSTAKYGDL